MNNILIRIPKFGQVALVLSAATAGVVAARYLESRKINGAERLSDALLRTEKLTDAAAKLPEKPRKPLPPAPRISWTWRFRRRRDSVPSTRRKTQQAPAERTLTPTLAPLSPS